MTHPHASWTPALSLLCLALAGCLAPTPTNQATADGDPREPLADGTSLRAPTWMPGTWFDVRLDVDLGFGVPLSFAGRVVALPDADGHLRLGSDSLDLSMVDGHADVPAVGPIDHELNPRVHDHRVQAFSWPLAANATWTTPWPLPFYERGAPAQPPTVLLAASPAEGRPGALRITGTTTHGETVDYDYDPAVGWWTYLRVINATTGRVLLSLDVTDHGHDFQGEAHVVTLTALSERIAVTPPCDEAGRCEASWAGVPVHEIVDVTAAYDAVETIVFLFTFPIVAAGASHASATVTDPTGATEPYHHQGAGDRFEFTFDRTVTSSPSPGRWITSLMAAGTGGAFLGLYGVTDEVVTMPDAA